MGLIDEKGRFFGKVSIIDIVIVLAIVVLVIGFVYNQTGQQIRQIIMADEPLYVTFLVEGVRRFSLDAVREGDVFFRQHERVPLGTVAHIDISPAHAIMTRTDGTAVFAPVEDRYNMYITLACVGSITDTGFFINGTLQVSEGGRLSIQSNNLLTMAMIYQVNQR
ncbi:MAG: DUF4330 domain-containing protein [Defluviitaleaceae bacterium]|nr:DUF4330 domain-containing protein [Defluviitaleaceae bacterium]